MIYSHELKLVFIKGRKVAGTSVEIALATLCGPSDIITPITPIDELERLRLGSGPRNFADDPATEQAWLSTLRSTPTNRLDELTLPRSRFRNHMPLTRVLNTVGPTPDGYVVAGVERDPYAKVLSWANNKVAMSRYKIGRAMQASRFALRRRLSRMIEDKTVLAVHNLARYRDQDGRLAVELMRYETLAEDFQRLLAGRGVPVPPPLPHVKKGLAAIGQGPRDLLTPQQIRQINTLFEDEFETYGYPYL